MDFGLEFLVMVLVFKEYLKVFLCFLKDMGIENIRILGIGKFKG